jgi:hypothetical protein
VVKLIAQISREQKEHYEAYSVALENVIHEVLTSHNYPSLSAIEGRIIEEASVMLLLFKHPFGAV